MTVTQAVPARHSQVTVPARWARGGELIPCFMVHYSQIGWFSQSLLFLLPRGVVGEKVNTDLAVVPTVTLSSYWAWLRKMWLSWLCRDLPAPPFLCQQVGTTWRYHLDTSFGSALARRRAELCPQHGGCAAGSKLPWHRGFLPPCWRSRNEKPLEINRHSKSAGGRNGRCGAWGCPAGRCFSSFAGSSQGPLPVK